MISENSYFIGHTQETEVFTRRGWRAWPRVNDRDEFLTPAGFQKASELFLSVPYRGDILSAVCEYGGGFEVTPYYSIVDGRTAEHYNGESLTLATMTSEETHYNKSDWFKKAYSGFVFGVRTQAEIICTRISGGVGIWTGPQKNVAKMLELRNNL